jgi:Cu-Zn family superoxide dismutase
MMTITLEVSGMPAGMKFGSHLHKLACDNNKAGGHYQHNPAPNADAGSDAGGPADPVYANAINEAWLDFTVGANGKGIGMTTVAWVPAMADAKAIIVHAMATGDGGIAGAKLACIPFAFK